MQSNHMLLRNRNVFHGAEIKTGGRPMGAPSYNSAFRMIYSLPRFSSAAELNWVR